ncbi:MAG: YdcF family protein [Limisphaerales bacterium]
MATPAQPRENTAPPPGPGGRRRRAWMATGVVAAVALFLGVRAIHPFLAITDPVAAKVMVVEGWLPDYALEEAVARYREDGYEKVFTTGGPLERGSYLSEHRTFAQSAAATLLKLGMATNEVLAVPASPTFRNRTYESAVALRDYLASQGAVPEAINLVSEGTHARRSRLCFQRALGRRTPVGIISIENRDYESDRWWKYSSGIKTIFGESIAVLYAWLSIDYGD